MTQTSKPSDAFANRPLLGLLDMALILCALGYVAVQHPVWTVGLAVTVYLVYTVVTRQIRFTLRDRVRSELLDACIDEIKRHAPGVCLPKAMYTRISKEVDKQNNHFSDMVQDALGDAVKDLKKDPRVQDDYEFADEKGVPAFKWIG